MRAALLKRFQVILEAMFIPSRKPPIMVQDSLENPKPVYISDICVS